jgi:hypothetical protein
LATDSQSLLDTVLETPPITTLNTSFGARWDKYVTSLNVKGPERDIVSNILDILSSQPGITLQYVRAHQDKQAAYNTLSLLGQLNVDADDMATLYQISHGGQRPLAFLTNSAQVQLITRNGSVTSKYSTALRFLVTYGLLMRHIEERKGWCPRVGRLINWKAYGTILKKRIKYRTHYQIGACHSSDRQAAVSKRSISLPVPGVLNAHVKIGLISCYVRPLTERSGK